MNTINNILNSPNWNIQNNQNNNQVSGTESQARTHHHHHNSNSQDSVKISDEGKEESANTTKSPLDSLVSNGTITQEQENSIRSAFMSARQANQSGTYSSKPTNPLNDLVANGTITQSQADSITDIFKSRIHSNENNDQVTGSEANHKIHHHHKNQQQGITDSSQSILEQPTENNDSVVNNILETPESQDTLVQNEESSL